MEVPAEKIQLDFYDDELSVITEGTPGGMYWGQGENGLFEISLIQSSLSDPERMVALMAHEIAHIKLLGENRIEENDEFLTELTCIFFGLGIFNANVAFRDERDPTYYRWSEIGYLTQMEWGYSLALFAFLRQEEAPAWIEHLCANVKADYRQAQRFIANNEELIFKLP